MNPPKIEYNCREELKIANLRITPARIAIIQLLESAKEPIDINTIINHLQKEKIKTNPSTAFRIINMFTNKGITIPIQFQEGKMRYELASRNHHHHLVCESCSRIEEISDVFIPNFEKEIKKKRKFLVKKHSLEFFGLCKNCQN